MSEPDIDPLGLMADEGLKQGVARRLAVGETVGCSGDIQRPGPGQQPTTDTDTTLLQGDGEQHRRGNVGAMRCQLVGRWRQLVGLSRQHHQHEDKSTQSRRCHCPFTCWNVAGSGPGAPRLNQWPRS
ncbi:hypothetical protein D3C73_1362200 [compost metagenome]